MNLRIKSTLAALAGGIILSGLVAFGSVNAANPPLPGVEAPTFEVALVGEGRHLNCQPILRYNLTEEFPLSTIDPNYIGVVIGHGFTTPSDFSNPYARVEQGDLILQIGAPFTTEEGAWPFSYLYEDLSSEYTQVGIRQADPSIPNQRTAPLPMPWPTPTIADYEGEVATCAKEYQDKQEAIRNRQETNSRNRAADNAERERDSQEALNASALEETKAQIKARDREEAAKAETLSLETAGLKERTALWQTAVIRWRQQSQALLDSLMIDLVEVEEAQAAIDALEASIAEDRQTLKERIEAAQTKEQEQLDTLN